jgi:Protein of unknown function (DUF3455)
MVLLGSKKMTLARTKLRDRIGLAVSAALLSACATVGPGPTAGAGPDKPGAVAAPSLGLFSRIKMPSDREPALQLSAHGVQVFRCEKRDSGFVWVFRQPDAQLLDASGKVVGRHGASFSFEHSDGSRLTATIVAYDEAPNAADLRWVLMTTRSFGKGSFEGITHVQRIKTRGGMPPEKCDAAQSNQLLRVDFSADFVFYRAKSPSAG